MALTIARVIALRSKFTVGPGGDITTDDLDAYETMANNRLGIIIGNRSFTPETLVELRALIILDMLVSKNGRSELIQETVTDSTWKTKGAVTSSVYMDAIKNIIDEYDNEVNKNGTGLNMSSEGVVTDDIHLDWIIEGYYYYDKWRQ